MLILNKVFTAGVYQGFDVVFNTEKIEIRLDNALITVQTLPTLQGGSKYNPVAYYSLVRNILNRVVSKSYKGMNKQGVWWKINGFKWLHSKIDKLWGKMIHNEWLYLIQHLDPLHLQLAKSLFSANFSYSHRAGLDVLINISKLDSEDMKEICRYRGAAMVAEHDISKFIPILGFYYTTDEPTLLKEDWRCTFAPNGNVNYHLKETVENLPTALSWHTLSSLYSKELNRPLLSKQELIIFTQSRKRQKFSESNQEEIIDSTKMMSKQFKKKYSCRKTNHLENICTYMHKYSDGDDNISKLVDKTYTNFTKQSSDPNAIPF